MQIRFIIVVLAVSLFGLASCDNSGSKIGKLDKLQQASDETQLLNNGTYTEQVELKLDGKHFTSISTEGAFLVQGDQVDWQIKRVQQQAGEEAFVSETVQIDNHQYQRMIQRNEQQAHSEWQQLKEETSDYPNDLEVLLEIDLEKEDIESIAVESRDNNTVYTISYSEHYFSKIKERNINMIESLIKEAQEKGHDNNDTLERSLALNKSINYLKLKRSYTLNEEGILINSESVRKVEQTVENTKQIQETTTQVSIVDYNLTDLKIKKEGLE
ncbi:hypothetical protein MUN88_21355 [Gracilibacillus caseinilyticus]|uniref:Uncharacterized protein n=1 Tax=Gracilibacillus caseinilyticus TaxID=2932256 RepID=A0ABY4EXG9_9BACI|nr:hypothetical protein [Gracilibacillus caseinilyticus]UOQ48543.1 hypothetical protein MUN88_21355 [Gracilibacillus caseinilyticus]